MLSVLEGFYSGVRHNPARSIFWLSRSWGSPDVNITHTTLHFTSSVVRDLPPAPTYHLCEAWWQSLWWGWDVSGRLLQYSVAWQRKAQRQLSPSYAVDTFLCITEERRDSEHKDRLWHFGRNKTNWMAMIVSTANYLCDKSTFSFSLHCYSYYIMPLKTFSYHLPDLLLSLSVTSIFLRYLATSPREREPELVDVRICK